MVEASAMCAVNEGVHFTSPRAKRRWWNISHHREQSEGDETCTTGVNSVQGRCRVINFGVRSDNSERSLPDSADRWQRSDRCFQCPLVSFHRQSYRGRMKNRFIYENDLQKNLRLLVERCQRVWFLFYKIPEPYWSKNLNIIAMTHYFLNKVVCWWHIVSKGNKTIPVFKFLLRGM